MHQIERITAEAWQQDAVLTMPDIGWLLNVDGAFARKMLDAYHERFDVVLPTAGTIIGVEGTLTYKAIVVIPAYVGLQLDSGADCLGLLERGVRSWEVL